MCTNIRHAAPNGWTVGATDTHAFTTKEKQKVTSGEEQTTRSTAELRLAYGLMMTDVALDDAGASGAERNDCAGVHAALPGVSSVTLRDGREVVTLSFDDKKGAQFAYETLRAVGWGGWYGK